MKNEDELEKIISKIRNGEEVKIPLVAFNYIYKNINKFSVISKDGKIVFVNPDDYNKFKQKALDLLENTKEEEEINVKEFLETIKNKEANELYTITTHEDGTIIKRDNVSQKIEIMKTDGTKIFIDDKNNKMITQFPKPAQEEKSLNDTKTIKEAARDKKKTEQKNKLLSNQVKELKSVLEKQKDIDAVKDIYSEEVLEFPDEEIYKENILKEEEKKTTQAVIHSEAKEQEIVSQNSYDLFKNTKHEQDDHPLKSAPKSNQEYKENLLGGNINNNDQKTISEKINSPALMLQYIDKNLFLNSSFSHKNIKEFMHYLLIFDNEIGNKCIIYNNKTNIILVNLNWFLYKIFALIMQESQQKNFVDDIYTNVDIGTINNEFLSELIEKLNQSATFAFGSKIIYQEKKENATLVNFKNVKIINEEKGEILQGVCLQIFMNNKFGEEFTRTVYFDKIQNSTYVITDDSRKGKRTNFNDICDIVGA